MTTVARRGSAVTIPFDVLSETRGLPAYELPAALATIYGGTLGFIAPCLYANFVSSVDGVVSLGHEHPSSGGAISGGSLADRFVMGLLRACADAVLIGAGTLRGSPGHVWTPGHVYPPGADHFTELRRHLGRSLDPVLFVVTASGDLDSTHPGLRAGSVILTGDAGAKRMRGRLPDGVVVRSLGDLSHLPIELVVDAVHEQAGEVVLTEGGPRLIGELLGANLLDEIFLTLSPVLFGRSAGDLRQGLVDGVGFAGGAAPQLEVQSVRRHGSHLFLRYGVRSQAER